MEIITVVASKEDKEKVYIVDLSNNRFQKISIDKLKTLKIENFDSKELKFKNDKYSVLESLGTLAYIDKDNKFYGILKERNGLLSVMWITYENAHKLIDNNDYFDNLSNTQGNVLIITGEKEITDRDWFKSLFGKSAGKAVIISSIPKYTLGSKETFLKETGLIIETEETVKEQEHIEKPIQKEEKSESTLKENTEVNQSITEQDKIDKNTDKNIVKVFDDYIKNIENKLSDIAIREKALQDRENELLEKSARLDKILASAEATKIDNVVDTIINVDNIYTFGNTTKDNIDKPGYVYELILKLLQKGDCITVPLSYYSTIKSYMRKSLESNMSFTEYKAMTTIKFNSRLNENIFAVIDYNENTSSVKITVLKEYNDEEVSDNDIAEYLIEYNKWRRHTLTIS